MDSCSSTQQLYIPVTVLSPPPSPSTSGTNPSKTTEKRKIKENDDGNENNVGQNAKKCRKFRKETKDRIEEEYRDLKLLEKANEKLLQEELALQQRLDDMRELYTRMIEEGVIRFVSTPPPSPVPVEESLTSPRPSSVPVEESKTNEKTDLPEVVTLDDDDDDDNVQISTGIIYNVIGTGECVQVMDTSVPINVTTPYVRNDTIPSIEDMDPFWSSHSMITSPSAFISPMSGSTETDEIDQNETLIEDLMTIIHQDKFEKVHRLTN